MKMNSHLIKSSEAKKEHNLDVSDFSHIIVSSAIGLNLIYIYLNMARQDVSHHV